MGRSQSPVFPVLRAANDNASHVVTPLPTPLARRGTRLCGTTILPASSPEEELRALDEHAARYREAVRQLAASQEALRTMLAVFR